MRERILQLAGEGEQRLGVQYAAGYMALLGVLAVGFPFVVPDADSFWLQFGCLTVPLIGIVAWARIKGWGREFAGGFMWGLFALTALLFPVVMAGVFLVVWIAS